jgi:hypothetical protein
MRNQISLLAAWCCAMTTTVAFQASASTVDEEFPGSQCTAVSPGQPTPWWNPSTGFVNPGSAVILANCPAWTNWSTVHNLFGMAVSRGWANTAPGGTGSCLLCWTGTGANTYCATPNAIQNQGTYDWIVWNDSIQYGAVEIQCYLPQNAVIYSYYLYRA